MKDKLAVLVVDDDPLVTDGIAKAVGETGKYDVLKAYSGEEALTVSRKEEVHIVLLDILMPGLDGIKTLDEVKMASPDAQVIMVTAVHDFSKAVEAIRLGAYDYITKPYEVEDLLDTVERAGQVVFTIKRLREKGYPLRETEEEKQRRFERVQRYMEKCRSEGREPLHEEVAKILGHTIYYKYR